MDTNSYLSCHLMRLPPEMHLSRILMFHMLQMLSLINGYWMDLMFDWLNTARKNYTRWCQRH